MDDKFRLLKVAIVTDWMLAPGGADRVLFSLLKIFPNAQIFTSIYNPKKYKGDWEIKAPVKETFLAKFPLRYKLSRHFNILTPMAFESLEFEGYDLVISISAGPAKGIITHIKQPSVSIICTPPRYLWDGNENFRGSRFSKIYKWISPFVGTYLRLWDQSIVKRNENLVAISGYIQQKIWKTYKRESSVIYPGIRDKWFEQKVFEKIEKLPKKYFLFASRLYDYKRVDWALKAAIDTCENLVVVGSGPDSKQVKKAAKKYKNITYLGSVSDNQLGYLYKNARAFIFPVEEDFGLVPVEAMACGTPVIAFNKGGAKETVVEGISGEFFANLEELITHLRTFDDSKYESARIIQQAQKFSESNFIGSFIKYLNEKYPDLTK